MATRTLAQSESPVTTTDSRPVPDPTVLTTQQLTARITALRDTIDIRFDGMDRAIVLLQTQANRSPTVGEVYAQFNEKFASIAKEFTSTGDIQKERFIRIDQQFVERDKRTDQLTLASSTAIAAALQAQKEAAGETQKSSSLAITKSETATVESIKQLQTLFQTSIAGLSTQILDVKSRLDKGEGGQVGQTTARSEARTETADSRGQVFGIIGVATSVLAMILVVLLHFVK